MADHPSILSANSARRSPYSRLIGKLRKHGEAVVYRCAGFGMTIAAMLKTEDCSAATSIIRNCYLDEYWQPGRLSEWLDIVVAVAIWPAAVLIASIWMTWRNGKVIAIRYGKSRSRQLWEQIRLAIRHGVLPPWYYIFELYDRRRCGLADDLLCRAETKEGAYPILSRARRSASPLSDKAAFADYCAERQLPASPLLAVAHYGCITRPPATLPASDLFIKPVRASGGSGAERWDYIGQGCYRNGRGQELDGEALVRHLARRSRIRPMLLQPRLINHQALADLGNGALTTVRVLTCLDEHEYPEVIAAALRMAVGDNHVVDNLHAGGVAAPVDLAEGTLGLATNLGADCRLGHIDRHPDSRASIRGRLLPGWSAVKRLATAAHSAFRDHVIIGWDIAILANGPCLVEGNSGPDLDIIQRVTGEAMGRSRLGGLLAHHLSACMQLEREAA